MRIIILLTIVLFSINGFSQTNSNKTIFKEVPAGEINKIIFNVSVYNADVIGQFKDELLGFEEKILRVHYDENSSLLTIAYNQHMLKDDLIMIFDKYQINYLVNKKSQSHNQQQ